QHIVHRACSASFMADIIPSASSNRSLRTSGALHPMNDSQQHSHPIDESLPPVAPDFIEQDWPDELDNIVPTRGYQMMPMVGLGGSAGSIQPLIEFFKAMPVDSGIAFVVILHLSPTHESTLDELLARSTSMPVKQASNGEKVLANHVYVIPPGKYLAAVNGHF